VRSGIIAGIITMKRERRAKSGNRFAFIGVSDQTGQFEAVVFADVLADAGDLLDAGRAVLLHVEAEREGEALKLRVQLVQSLDKAAGGIQRGLRVDVDDPAAFKELRQTLKKGHGMVEVLCRLPGEGCEVPIRLKGGFDISPSQAGAIMALPGVRAVHEL
jgi:DNA polymerase-3 subunit alpha